MLIVEDVRLDTWGFCHIHGVGVISWDMTILIRMRAMRRGNGDSIVRGYTIEV